MEAGFRPMEGAEGWQLSNAPVLGMAAHLASLEIFAEAGMEQLREKSDKLTQYLEFLLDDLTARHGEKCRFEVITPRELNRRGAQLSILVHGEGKRIFDAISAEGVVADWREPNVIRVAPVPLYNTFEDVYWLGQFLEKAING